MSHRAVLVEMIDSVWTRGDLDALPRFWTGDCVNHSAPEGAQRGLPALRAYHAAMLDAFAAFDDPRIEILQQVEEGDRVVTYARLSAVHARPFLGAAPTGRTVTLTNIRIDRIEDGKIAEHWSVADMAGLMAQMQRPG